MFNNDRAATRAAALLKFRRARGDYLPEELFFEHAWDLLLELFVADAAGHSLTGEEVGARLGAAPTTLSRWLMLLDRKGLVVGDGSGDLTDKLVLSAQALDAIERLMQDADMLFALAPRK